jgi:hypothetical protein
MWSSPRIKDKDSLIEALSVSDVFIDHLPSKKFKCTMFYIAKARRLGPK